MNHEAWISNDLKDGASVYLDLSTLHVVPMVDQVPSGFYVVGVLSQGLFVPKSDVLGEGDFASQGQAGWLELASGKFYSLQTGRAPQSPYINGFLAGAGFVPSSTQIR